MFLGILAVWRLTYLLNAEDGPWYLLVRLRRVVGDGSWGLLLDCFYCLSLWIAAPFAYWLGVDWKDRLLLWPALSGAAVLAEKLTSRPPEKEFPVPVYFGPQEDSNVLRQESTASSKPD